MIQAGWDVNASTSATNSGRGTQPDPWKSESTSTYGTSSRAESVRPNIVLPAPLLPPTKIRLIDEPSDASVAGVVPSRADSDRDVERHIAERVGAGHLLPHDLLDLLSLARRDLEHQLVVHLQQQP